MTIPVIATFRDTVPALTDLTIPGTAPSAAHLVIDMEIESATIHHDKETAPKIGVTLIERAPRVALRAQINANAHSYQAYSVRPVKA
jgi:hypothetical protein